MVKALVFAAVWALSAYGQNSTTGPLTNETVIRLVASGVPADTVIKTIQAASSVSFGFLPGDLALLQRYNVSDEIVKAMAAKANGRPAPQASQPTPPKTLREQTQAKPEPRQITTPTQVLKNNNDANPRAETCSFTILAQLVDKDLNPKPVPKLKLSFREVNATRKQPFSTTFEGRLVGELPCGTYSLTSDEPLAFDTKTYSWDLRV